MIHLIDIETLKVPTAATLKKADNSTKTDDIDRDGQNVGNLGAPDYFGKRDKAKKNPKVDKNRPKPKRLKKSDYFGIYINKKQALGGEHHSTHLSGVTSVPVQPVGGPPERDIEVRPANSGTNVPSANQDAYDKATQGGLVRLTRGDVPEIVYMNVHTKADGYLLGYGGSTADRASFAAGQGDQSQLRSIPVLGATEWTASIIPPKVLKKANPTKYELFPMCPEDPELAKSISQGDLVQHNNSVTRAEVPDPGDQKYYDFANAYIQVLHKSYQPDSIFPMLQEKAKQNELLAKSMDVCRIDNSYVLQCAANLYREKNTIGATDYAVQKALSHFE